MRSIFLLLSILLTTLPAVAQDQREWTLYKEIEGVSIYFQETNCTTNDAPAQVAYIVKVVNTTGRSLSVSWDLAVWYNYVRQSEHISDGENHYTVDLAPNQTLVGDCNTPYGALYIFKDFITYVSPTKLTKFEFENIQVAQK